MNSSLRFSSAILVCTAFASSCANGESADVGVRRDTHSIDAASEQLDVFIPSDDVGGDAGGPLPDSGPFPDMGVMADTGPAPVDAFLPVDVGNDVGRDSGPSCVDRDGDGAFVGPASCGPVDCDDMNASRNPDAPELCNNVDDNCNGTIDDGIPMQMCGTGACQRTAPGCSAGSVPVCAVGAPSTEVCNNVDDNCDGVIDNGIPAISCGIATCARTVAACVGGVPQACTPGAPGTEVCNGLDDDCDTVIDDGFGTVTCGTGSCQRTVNSCMAGTPQTCTPGAPASEVCNNLDDNCDGVLDNGLGTTSCGVGLCARTVSNCVSGIPQSCSPGSPALEVCGNGIDENCNGPADDTCSITGDLCTSPLAIDMSVPAVTLSGTTAGAVNNVFGGCVCASGSDVFYSFTLARTEYVWANTLGTTTAFDGSLFFTNGSCATLPARTLPELVCDDDGGPLECGSRQSQVFAVLPAGTYRLAVSGCGSGAYQVNFAHYPVGSLGNGGAVAAGGSTLSGTITAGIGVSPPGCFAGGAERSHYWLTCPAYTGGNLTASMCGGSSWDSLLSLHHSNSTTQCDDDGCGGIGLSRLNAVAQPAGAALHVLYVEAFSTAGGGAYSVAMTRP